MLLRPMCSAVIHRYDVPCLGEGSTNAETLELSNGSADMCCYLLNPRTIAPTLESAFRVKMGVLIFGECVWGVTCYTV